MELTLIPQILAAGKPLLGICRGMQALNVACGGTLWQDVGDAFPHSQIRHAQQKPYTRPVHPVHIDEASHLAQIMGATDVEVNSIHHQAVDKPGRGLAVAAQAPDGVIEAVEMPERPFVVGVQWHPEFLWPTHPEDARLFERLVAAAAAHRDTETAER
jgi:putative glutamine amidotransferase